MKKTIALLVGALAVSAAFAGANNVRIMFSTPGPDKYADNTDVKAGERYALVWKESADVAVTFSADGTVSGGKAVLVWDTKENGHCDQVLFQVDEDWMAANGYDTGVWSVYLLDTRVYSGDGSAYTYSSKNDSGVPSVINSSSLAVANVDAQASVTAGAVSGGTASALPDGVGQPKVTGINVTDQFVEITVENTSPCINYVVSEGSAVDGSFAPNAGAAPKAGNGTITLVTPKSSDGQQFFKVDRK